MAEFRVDTDSLRAQADMLAGLQTQLQDVSAKLTAVQISNALQIRPTVVLTDQVASCRWAVAQHIESLGHLYKGLDSIAENYDTIEKGLSEPKTEAAQQKEESSKNWLDWMVDHFGDINMAASIFSFLWGAGKTDTRSIIESMKRFSKIVGDAASLCNGETVRADWFSNTVLGLRDLSKGGKYSSFGDFMQLEFDKYNYSAADSLGKKIQVGAKWAGVVCGLGISALDNYQEFNGDLSNYRFWGETVLETGIDILKGSAISAGVATALVATIGSAPAVLVAAVGGLACVTVDWAFEQITGKELTESISDLAFDCVEGIADACGDFGKSVADGVSAAWNGLVGGWNKVFG